MAIEINSLACLDKFIGPPWLRPDARQGQVTNDIE